MSIRRLPLFSVVLPLCLGLAACSREAAGGRPGSDPRVTIGVAFDTLQTEFWVAAIEAMRAEFKQRDITMLEAIADNDANRQFQQVRNFINRKVDGIILVPKDAKTCLPMIRAANEAGIPIVLFNRPADKTDLPHTAVVADNFSLAKATVDLMIDAAKKTGRKRQALVVLGDLGDINAIGRRDGFEAAIRGNEPWIEVVARVPSEWNQEKAQAGVANALQANPGIDFIFTSSDFLLPSIVSALKAAGRYHPAGSPDHVMIGGFDGDITAYEMLRSGHLFATGVQDVYYESHAAVQAILDRKAGKPVEQKILDPGFVIHRGNMDEMASRMWGAQLSGKR